MAILQKSRFFCRIAWGVVMLLLCAWVAGGSAGCTEAPCDVQRVGFYAASPSRVAGPSQFAQNVSTLQGPANGRNLAVVQLIRRDYEEAGLSRLFPARPLEPKQKETICYGRSGSGRELLAYRFGTGKHVLVATFAIHGWEDNFQRDGQLLSDTADLLMQALTGPAAQRLTSGDWTVYVLPCLNPDGLYDGWTCNGPGRCTTHCLDADGLVEEGPGVDLNRCFPYSFVSDYSARNYCGSEPLRAREAVALAQFTQSVMGDGYNILIDTHGWYCQTIVSDGWSGDLFQTFQDYFPGNSYASLRGAEGYYSAWAAYELGYDACLFEFPSVSSARDFREKGYGQDYVEAVCAILETYGSR